MKLKSLIACAVIIMAACAFLVPATAVPAAAADKVVTWKCQVHWPASSASYSGSLLVVIDRVKKRSNGRFIIEPYSAGALVPPKEVFNAVKRGMIPIGITSSAYPRAQVPLMNVASGLPCNFGAVWEAAYYYTWMGFEKMLQAEVLKHGMYCFTDRVYPTELALKKPVRTFADFQGLKLRSSGVLQVFLTSIGASASYIPGSEIYAALASGVVEGAHWGAVQGNNSMKFYDICKYHLRPALNVAGTDIWLINKKALDGLPADLRKILVNVLEEEFWLRTNQYEYLEDLALAKIIKEGKVELVTLPPAEYAKLQAAAIKMWDEVAKKGPACAKAVEMLKEFNRKMGRIK